MCTAVNLFGTHHLFGRTFDYEKSFGQQVVSSPRRFSFGEFESAYSIIGVATVVNGMPLYFDGMNERGLCGAALNFPMWSTYHPSVSGKINIPSYHLLSYILGSCTGVGEARERLKKVNVTPDSISEDMPATPLHWIFADGKNALVVESVREGVKIYDNPMGILSNSPPFDYHGAHLAGYMSLHSGQPENRISRADLPVYSRGMAAMGLPGDFSSTSRFVRAAFLKKNALVREGDSAVTKYFHIMESLSIPYGVVRAEDGSAVSTIYTCLADTAEKIFYFTTYSCRRIQAVRHNPEIKKLCRYSMDGGEDIRFL